MKQNKLSMILIIVFCMMFVFTMASDGLAKDKPIKLIINNVWPATHHINKNVFIPWAKEVEKKTNGRVKVEIYSGGILGKITSTIEDTAVGKCDVSLNVPSYQYDRHILVAIAELAFAFPSVYVGHEVLKKLTKKYSNIVAQEFDEVEVMGFAPTDGYILFSRTPIRRLADLKNKLVSLKSKSFKPVIEAWGAVPVSIATPEAYAGLQRGTIDVLTYSRLGGLSYKFYEVGPYVNDGLNLWNFVLCGIMNKRWLNALPEDLQKLFREELNPSLMELITYNDYGPKSDKASIKLKEKAKEVIRFSPEEKAKLVECGKPAWDYWLKQAKKQGLPAEHIMADFKKFIEEEGYKIPF